MLDFVTMVGGKRTGSVDLSVAGLLAAYQMQEKKAPTASLPIRRNTTMMARSDAEYAAVMKGKGWLATGTIAAALGKSNRAGIGVLRRLLTEGKVERREVPRKQGHPYMEWRWI